MPEISFRKRAVNEYIEAVNWHNERSLLAAENFVNAVNDALSKIKIDPLQFRNSYKNFHELKIKKYPFTLVYFINTNKSLVVITTFFHHKRDPKKILLGAKTISGCLVALL